jgi:hypothetical protein
MSRIVTMSTEASPLQADLAALLAVTRAAERDLFGMLDQHARDEAGTIGQWSAKDVQAHLAAWRAIEARRLEAAAAHDDSLTAGDPVTSDPVDGSNADIHARYADWAWEMVARDADESVDALIAAIGRSTNDVLCECDEYSVAGIGSNGANHALGHLSDIARMAGDSERYDAFVREVEAILAHSHVPPHDSGVILYNIACHRALTGDLDEARRLLSIAFAWRGDLRETALEDSDLVALREEIRELA